MPKRKSNQSDDEAAAESLYTFKLANGEPFDVQGVKILVEQLVYKSIEYTNKKLKEQNDIDEGIVVREKEKKSRRRYSREEKRQIIAIYDKYPVKEAALEVNSSFGER